MSVSLSLTHAHTHMHTQICFIRVGLQTSFLRDEEERKLLLTYQWHLPAGSEIALGHTRAPGGAPRPDLKGAPSPSPLPPPRLHSLLIFIFYSSKLVSREISTLWLCTADFTFAVV